MDYYSKKLNKELISLANIINLLKVVITTEYFHEVQRKMKQVMLDVLEMLFRYIKAYVALELEAVISYIFYTIGYLPKDWQISKNMIIEKKRKSNRVQDPYIINFIEAYSNFNNKLVVRTTLNCTEADNLLP